MPNPDSSGAPATIDALLQETRRFPPPNDFTAQANVRDQRSISARTMIPRASGRRRPTGSTGSSAGTKCWSGTRPGRSGSSAGQLNASYNCVDRHIATWRRNKAAIIWEGEPGDTRVLTYRDLYREVNDFAAVLLDLGIKKGDCRRLLYADDS